MSPYVQGQKVWYRVKCGQWHSTHVISVHCDDTEPYYGIAYGSATRETEAYRLAPREATSQVFDAVGERSVRTPQDLNPKPNFNRRLRLLRSALVHAYLILTQP